MYLYIYMYPVKATSGAKSVPRTVLMLIRVYVE